MTVRSLPRSAPSAQGVDAGGVLAFLDAADAAGVDMHSLMLVRHGHVVAEGWWAPYRSEHIQLLYSLSKSFTSTAIGMAQAEGLLSIDDAVIDFFPEKVAPGVASSLADLKVRHLLAMASGHTTDTRPALGAGGRDVVRNFLSIPREYEAGSFFCYNQGCTYTLSAIITKLTGQRLVDYLRPRLFDPLGIDQAYWVQSKEGIDQGFSGLHLTTESVAKLGQLYLQNGSWGGQQLVPASYVAQARSKLVDNSRQAVNPDWQQGYGFQFWVSRHDAYRGDGAFGQFCIVVPGADAVIACTAQVEDMQAEIDLIWQHILPAVSGDAAGGHAADGRLSERLLSLSTASVDSGSGGPDHELVFKRTGEPAPHTGAIESLSVEPGPYGARLTVLIDGVGYPFDLRPGQWTEGDLPGLRSLPPVAVSGGWTAADEFAADIVSLSSPHRLQLRAKTLPEPTVDVGWYTTPL